MTKITLTNDFHNTSVNLVVTDHGPGDTVVISDGQYRRARRELCGMAECRCGGTYSDDHGDHILCRDAEDREAYILTAEAS